MQPCSREMQGMNSLLQELQNQQNHSSQIQSPHFDPSSQHHQSSNDDFLEQMLSTIPSCSWADLKSPWDINPTTTATSTPANLNLPNSKPPRDLSDETVPSNPDGSNNPNNVGFHAFDDSALLATKLRQHQISGGGGGGGAGPPSPSMAKMLLQQQLMLAAAARGGLPPNDVIDGSSFKSPTRGGDGLFNGFGAGSMHGTNQPSPQHFQHPQGIQGAQNFGAVMNQQQQQQQQQQQPQASGSTGGAPGQPRQRVRARRGQATDPHSIAERLRRERIAERMKALQELVPNANKTDKASMLDEIIDYVKFLQLQVKVLSMSRLGGAAAVAPLVADMSSEGGGDCIQANANGGSLPRTSNGGNNSNSNNQTTSASTNDSLTVTEHQVAKLMEEDMGSAMQYLQGKGLCLMPISLATAISTATCHTRSPVMSNANANGNGVNNGHHHHPLLQSNGEGPSSPSMSVLTVQSATMGNGGGDGSVKDAASVSKP